MLCFCRLQFQSKVIDCQNSSLFFSHGITARQESTEKNGKNKSANIKIEKVLLHKKWKCKDSEYPDLETVFSIHLSQDSAFLLLQDSVLPSTNHFPSLRAIDPNNIQHNMQIQSYGYPGYFEINPPRKNGPTILRKSNGIAGILPNEFQNGWGIFTYNSFVTHGKFHDFPLSLCLNKTKIFIDVQ